MIEGERVKPKYLWFKASIAFGVLLGLLLLAQTLWTYHWVSQNLVRQEAAREADRRVLSVGRAARLMGASESVTLTPVLHELVHESPQQIAWIRILNSQGGVIAGSERVDGAPQYAPGDLEKMLANRDRRPQERATPSGKVLITVNPLRFAPPPFVRPADDPSRKISSSARPAERPSPGPSRGGGRRGLEVVEIAIYLSGISTHFGGLQENLIIGCMAALALLAAVMVMAFRFRHYMQGKYIEEELSLARRVQTDLFPAESSLTGNLAFAAKCVPAYQVGGDLYDVFETDDGEVALVLGDVSGKGLPAALLMGVVQGAVQASCGTGAAANHEQAAERLNHLLCMKTARERFVSLFWCYFDRRQALLRYINAGHLPPLLVRRDGAGTKVIRLDEGGPVLGLLPGARYTQAQVPVSPGDLLVVFSDGILEAANSRDEEFGEESLLASIERNWHRKPGEVCAAILADVRTFLGRELPQDDQTLLVVRLDEAIPESRAESLSSEVVPAVR